MEMAWLEAKEKLGIEVIAPYKFELDGVSVAAIAYLPDFGSSKGTLVFEIAENSHLNLAKSHGYFCSELNPEIYGYFKHQQFQEALNDWQWSSKSKKPPSWYTGQPWI